MKTIKYILILTFIILLQTNCSEDYLDVSDPNNIDKSVFWTSESNAVKAVNAIYSAFKEPEFLDFDYPLFTLFVSGEWDRPYLGDQARLEFVNFTIKSENKINYLMWKAIFRCILRCNDVISNVPTMSDEILSPEKKNQLSGEAYFLRGFIELYALQMYGKYYPDKDSSALGIPIILKVPLAHEDMFVKRASVGASYNQIISDFDQARNLLPLNWDNNNIGRATKGAAIAYAAKTHMWLNNYGKAISTFDELFNLGIYTLNEKYDNNLNGQDENNSESIFELQYADLSTNNPWTGGSAQSWALEFGPAQIARGNSGITMQTADCFALSYTITQKYLDNKDTKALPADILAYMTGLLGQTIAPDVFKKNLTDKFGESVYFANITNIYKWIESTWDPRWKATAFQPGDSVKPSPTSNFIEYAYLTSLYTPKKYTDNNRNAVNTGGTFGANTDNIPVYRLSYAYLLYAEAQNEQGNTDIAIEYLNKVRQRAYKQHPELYVPVQTGITKEQFRDILDLENIREFCGECVRWYDLVRWGLAEKYCARRGFTKGIHEVLPIPKDEIDLNPNMVQNSGY